MRLQGIVVQTNPRRMDGIHGIDGLGCGALHVPRICSCSWKRSTAQARLQAASQAQDAARDRTIPVAMGKSITSSSALRKALAAGDPAIAVKKKELGGDFKSGGRE